MAKWSKKNKEEYNKTRREWYRKNIKKEKSRLRASNIKRKEKMTVWWKEYKSSLSCKECSENHPGCIDFHHRNSDEKETNLSLVIYKGWGKEKILKEVDKCDILCSNCHRKLHWYERNKILSL